jgi:hypothetical protein
MKEFLLKLFDEHGQYSEAALSLDMAVSLAIRPFFEDYMKMGFSPREIAHIVNHAILGVEMEEMMDVMFKPDGAPKT